MHKQELKPCCWCGEVVSYVYHGSGDHSIECKNCGLDYSVCYRGLGKEVKKQWNTRPEEDKLNARIKELEEGLQHIINHVENGMQGGVKAFSMHAHWYIATKTLNKGNKK